MQSFLPEPDFEQSLHLLDQKRLGKQRLETLELIVMLEQRIPQELTPLGQNYVKGCLIGGPGWKRHHHHPALKMWYGYTEALRYYFNVNVREWIVCRSYQHNLGTLDVETGFIYPPWVGNVAFHNSHKSNLIQKKPEYYQPFWPHIEPGEPYVWPVSDLYDGQEI